MKRLLTMILTLCMCCGIFAQNVKSTGLTDADVKNFVKNYPKIEEELNKLDVEFSSDIGFSDVKAYTKAVEILAKFGISGDNTYEKINMMCLCYGVITIDKTMAELDAESRAMMLAMGSDPAAEYRKLINEKDLKIVENNYDELVKVLNQ